MDPPPPPKLDQKKEKPKPESTSSASDIPRDTTVKFSSPSELKEKLEEAHPKTAQKCSKCTPTTAKPPVPPPPCPSTCKNLESQWHASSHTCIKSTVPAGSAQKAEARQTCVPPVPSADKPVPLPPSAPCVCGSRAPTPHSCFYGTGKKRAMEPAVPGVCRPKCDAAPAIELPTGSKANITDPKPDDKDAPPKERKEAVKHKCELLGPPRPRPPRKKKEIECDYCKDNMEVPNPWFSRRNLQRAALAVLLLGTLVAIGVMVAKKTG